MAPPYKLHDQSFMPDHVPRAGWYKSDVWTKEGPDTPVTFYTDWALDALPAARTPGVRRVVVLLEPPAITDNAYREAERRAASIDLVLTHQRDLVGAGPGRSWYPYGTTWIHDAAERRVHPKTRGVSLIASAKRSHEGHRVRHAAASALGTAVELYGRGYRPVASKVEALGPFRFSVVVENCRARGYFSEKLVDCLMTGTVPIYWGCPDVAEYVDPAGVLVAGSLEALVSLARRAASDDGPALYQAMLPAVARNLVRALEYVAPDRWIVDRLEELLRSCRL